MNFNEIKAIMLKAASGTMKKEGEETFKKGLVTYFKGKKIDPIYHIYGRVKDESLLKELNTHIRIDFNRRKLEGVECSCDEFKEFASSGYTFMCSHITATAYKFFSLLMKDKKYGAGEGGLEKKSAKENKIPNNGEPAGIGRLIRKTEKASLYYEAQAAPGSEKLHLQPDKLRNFLENLMSGKIRFKFDYIEFMVPILHKDLPVTFNLKEEKERIVLTTYKEFPIPLNSKNDVYYFKNEIYLPSKDQILRYVPLYDKLKATGSIFYRKDINNYNNLISLLGSISKNINIAESLRNYAADNVKPEFFLFEEKGDIYCEVLLSYGGRKISILAESKGTDTFLRDHKKEEKLLMEMEKYGFARSKNRFTFTGSDEELFNILSGKIHSIISLGKVILGRGLKDRKIYDSASIKADLYENNGYYDFIYSIGDIKREELNNAFEAYRAGKKFYKTKDGDFLDFDEEGVRSFLNLFEVLDINEAIEDGKIKLEKIKALYAYENIKDRGFSLAKNLEDLQEIEDKLFNINSMDIIVPDGFKGTLREYQLKGFKWLKALSEIGFGGILADEMGLGKTVQTIAFLLSEQKRSTLIVCPTSLIYNWKDEFNRFAPSLKVGIAHGQERMEVLEDLSDYDVILTTYGTLRIDIEHYSGIVFHCCIIDEGQNIKNTGALNTKVIKEIKANTRFALTGTPIENNLTELWSIFDFIMPGYLYSKEKFEEKFLQRGVENLESLKLLIKPFILRRTKKEVMKELPDKIEKKFLVEMTPSQKAVYSRYIKTVRDMMKSNTEGKIEIFSYLTRLRQICLDPSLIMEDYEGGSGKLKVALELIKNHIASGSKVLLFSQFTSVLDKIGEGLKKEGIEFYHLEGKTKPKDRIQRVKDFNSSGYVRVFLISLKAGGTGLNLTSANLVIHFDPWWNPAVEDQAADRAHRIGQSEIVEVIKLVARGTVEEKIITLQKEKKELIENVLDGEFQSGSIINSLSKADIIELFNRD